MIRITDMTLSCLDGLNVSAEQLRKLADYLISLGVDYIEVTPGIYEKIKPRISSRFILRIKNLNEAGLYSEITRFICRRSRSLNDPAIVSEVQINDIKELNFLGGHASFGNIRLVGLDDILFFDYESIFNSLRQQIRGRLELCPENSFFCATAAAVEWILAGGKDIVTTFGGLGGKAPLEEVLLALRVTMRFKPNASFKILPHMAALMEEILSEAYDDRKPVIGKKIFNVESGIHIDGLLKKSGMYEPFLPELVGSSRKFIIGKHSGTSAVKAKLMELSLEPEHYDSTGLLNEIRFESTRKMSSLSDEELFLIAQKHRKQNV